MRLIKDRNPTIREATNDSELPATVRSFTVRGNERKLERAVISDSERAACIAYVVWNYASGLWAVWRGV